MKDNIFKQESPDSIFSQWYFIYQSLAGARGHSFDAFIGLPLIHGTSKLQGYEEIIILPCNSSFLRIASQCTISSGIRQAGGDHSTACRLCWPV